MTRSWPLLWLLACGAPASDSRPTASSPTPGTPAGSPTTGTPATLSPNILLVVADDIGVDKVKSYQPTLTDLPPQPTLDQLAADGIRFTDATVSPLCSPTRASLLTGRHPHQLGIGQAINNTVGPVQLPLGEVTIAELLQAAPTPYATALMGKWHLATVSAPNALDHAVQQGFDTYLGAPSNLNGQSYFAYQKLIDGELVDHTVYATTDTVDDALAWLADAPEPWFLTVAFHAPHSPLHSPPDHLISEPVPPGADQVTQWNAMVESMDTELGRLLDPIDRSDTVIVFLGDNGTLSDAITPPFDPNRAKQTLYEGGVQVPWIVVGPGVPAGASSSALIDATDLFPTLAELAGVDADALGGGLRPGHSLVPLWTDPADPGPRDLVHSELFFDFDGPPFLGHRWSVRDRDHKLIGVESDVLGTQHRLYDLHASPWDEGPELVAPLSPDDQAALDRLIAAHADWMTALPYAPEPD